MSKKFKCRIEAELREPVTKNSDGILTCKIHFRDIFECSDEDYLYFCISLVQALIDEADEAHRATLKRYLETYCSMPEEFFLAGKQKREVPFTQLISEESNGDYEK